MKTTTALAALAALATTLLAGTTTTTALAAPAHAAPTDTVPPTVNVLLSTPANDAGWHRTPVEVRVSATDRSGLDPVASSLWVSGAQTETYDLGGGSAELVVSTEGVTTLRWEVSDQEGNVRRGETTVRLDRTAPTGAIVGGSTYVDQGAIVPVTLPCADTGGSGFGDGGCLLLGDTTWDESGHRLWTAGVRDIVVRASLVDRAGNETALSRTYRVVPAGAAPVVTLAAPDPTGDHGWHTAPVEVAVDAAAADPRLPVQRVVHTVDGGAETSVDGAAATITVAAEGRHVVRATAYDVDDRVGTAEREVAVDTVAPSVLVDVPATATVGDDVVAAVGCNDATSLVAVCELTGGTDAAGRVDTSAPGTVVVSGLARDHAGHVTTVEQVVLVRPAGETPGETPGENPGAVRSAATARASYAVRGRKVVATVTVTGRGAARPTGRVVLRDGARVVGRGTLTTAGRVRITTRRLAPGRHRLVATYTGSRTFLAATTKAKVVRVR